MARNGHVNGADAIRHDIEALRSDFAALSRDFRKLRRNGAKDIQDTVEARIDRITDSAGSIISDAEEQISSARKLCKDHPLATISGAFSLGLIAAKLLR
jgi:ElaB/YqjD/DUF883 family membrane-anchored ribosome-binding protein